MLSTANITSVLAWLAGTLSPDSPGVGTWAEVLVYPRQAPEVVVHPVSGTPGASRREDLDDAALVELISEADPDALGVLYQRHGSACYRMAVRITANQTLAEDAVQEAFTGLWRDPGAYTPGQGSVRSWLLGLTHHKAVDMVRRETAQQRRQNAQAAQQALDPPVEADPAAAAWAGIRAAEVRAALAELPEPQRHALALAYFGGYTQREIAQLTGVPLGTVKTRMFAAMRRLQVRLATVANPAEGGTL
jgi:RNA polymerase sigma factor (sigma-70 family)